MQLFYLLNENDTKFGVALKSALILSVVCYLEEAAYM